MHWIPEVCLFWVAFPGIYYFSGIFQELDIGRLCLPAHSKTKPTVGKVYISSGSTGYTHPFQQYNTLSSGLTGHVQKSQPFQQIYSLLFSFQTL